MDNLMAGYEKFQAAILGRFREILGEMTLAEIEADLAKLWTKHALLGDVFRGFIEIHESYKTLRDIEVYIRRFPYSDTKIQKTRHLRYHIESYLNEMYILKERLEAFAKRMARRHRKSPWVSQEGFKKLIELVITWPNEIVKTRGSHVHSRRFSADDLQRLEGWEIFLQEEGIDANFIANLEMFEEGYRTTRKKWQTRITENNDSVKVLLDAYFGALYAVLFDEKGQLKLPYEIGRVVSR